MKVLQLIDSLDTGGAERVAVNFANSLSETEISSYLCATRHEGLLKIGVLKTVGYLFLNKKGTLDLKAILRLRRFIKKEQITIIHAHSSSFFLATLLKLTYPKLKLVWHDHYGKSEFLSQRPKLVLKLCSLFFNHVFCVNQLLVQWNKKHLFTKHISYLPNFAVINNTPKQTNLKGEEGKRIVCLANLRPQKNHEFLIQAFKEVLNTYPDWTLHLVGKDFKDLYSEKLKGLLKTLDIEEHVFIYGSCPDTSQIIKQATLTVLSSISEGLPLALLEYGLLAKPTIATNVGQCQEVIINNQTGILITSNDLEAFINAIKTLIRDQDKASKYSNQLLEHVTMHFSQTSIINQILKVYRRFA